MKSRVFPRAMVIALAVFAATAPAASAQDPAPGLEEFSGCPAPPAAVDHCTVSETTGSLQLGRVKLDIKKPIVLSGGVPGGSPAPFLFNDRGGMFSPRIPIRGIPIVGTVYAVPQLAGTVMVALPFGEQMPLKVKLEHPLLGRRCYIGSDGDPIALDLTTGTTAPPPPNQPITGRIPGFAADPEDPRVFLVTDGVLVDNAFRAPGARGCGPHGVLNRVVERAAALPSAAGRNTAILAFGARSTTQAAVYP